jgi:UDP-2,3-diacylglucosamine hydrolase
MFKKLLNKKIRCDKIDNFEELAKQKIDAYSGCQLIIEGHYHQDCFFENYINLPSLYCQKSFLQVKNGTFITIFMENIRNT